MQTCFVFCFLEVDVFCISHHIARLKNLGLRIFFFFFWLFHSSLEIRRCGKQQVTCTPTLTVVAIGDAVDGLPVILLLSQIE